MQPVPDYGCCSRGMHTCPLSNSCNPLAGPSWARIRRLRTKQSRSSSQRTLAPGGRGSGSVPTLHRPLSALPIFTLDPGWRLVWAWRQTWCHTNPPSARWPPPARPVRPESSQGAAQWRLASFTAAASPQERGPGSQPAWASCQPPPARSCGCTCHRRARWPCCRPCHARAWQGSWRPGWAAMCAAMRHSSGKLCFLQQQDR